MAAKRDKNGRFVKGHGGGPGRPKRAVEDRYLEALRKAISIKDLQAIFDTGFSRARAGDLGWARLICEYLIGKPVQKVDASVGDDNTLTLRVVYGSDGTND